MLVAVVDKSINSSFHWFPLFPECVNTFPKLVPVVASHKSTVKVPIAEPYMWFKNLNSGKDKPLISITSEYIVATSPNALGKDASVYI